MLAQRCALTPHIVYPKMHHYGAVSCRHSLWSQTVDNIKSEGYALGKAKEQAAREVADKRTALRRLENQALERKNRSACWFS